MSILVLGSINADLVLSAPRLPKPGETIRARRLDTYAGGKGANQATAAARMGAEVHLIGRVGDDASGQQLLDSLRSDGVGTDAVVIDPGAPTGTALITVGDDGANTIVTVGGANHRVGPPELDALSRRLPGAHALLVQLEIPMEVVAAAVRAASEAGVVVVCDPAPVSELPPEILRCLGWITPNEHESAELTGMDDPRAAAEHLHEAGVDHAVVTLGERGCLYVGLAGTFEIPAPAVTPTDTVACGDAFNGALAARLAEGDEPTRALEWAVAAGAEASTRAGAGPSLPTRDEVGSHLDRRDM